MGRHETNKNEALIEGQTPWLRSVLYLKGMPSHLRGELIAEAKAKALSALRDIESGRLRPPAKPEQYFKQVMRNAIAEWFRSRPRATPLTPDEVAMVDDVVYDEDEGTEGTWGWQGERVLAGIVQQGPRRRPFMLVLLREFNKPFADPEAAENFWGEGGPEGEWKRVQQQLDELPNERRREAVLLDLQNYRQKDIAERLLVTQPAVSKALQQQYAAWGWDKKQVQRIQFILLYVNTERAVWRGLKQVGLEFDEFEQGFELPKPGRELEASWRAVYQAIMSDPALACWTDGLELRHMRELIDLVHPYADYDESSYWS